MADPFHLFISYAHEDEKLAAHLHHCLEEHFAGDYADFWIDNRRLRAGLDLTDQLRGQLDRTDVLLIVYTGQQKDSHSFTGLEVGYFIGTIPKNRDTKRPRYIVSFYLDRPPDALANTAGVPFGIDLANFPKNDENFSKVLTDVSEDHPFARFINQLETQIDQIRQEQQFPPIKRESSKRVASTRKLLAQIYNVLKDRKQNEQNPQSKMIIELGSSADQNFYELPLDAVLRPNREEATAIFGLPFKEYTWAEFILAAKERHRIGWKDVIEKVIRKSANLEYDNSQVIVGNNAKELFRVFITSSIKYLGGRREFHLYFLSYLQREDFGNPETTLLQNALDLCCRFRFMFFEKGSPFSARSIEFTRNYEPAMRSRKLKNKARELIKELNILLMDSAASKLDEPDAWGMLIDYRLIMKMSEDWLRIEPKVRSAVHAILESPAEVPDELRSNLKEAVVELYGAFNTSNATLISQLCTKLAEASMKTVSDLESDPSKLEPTALKVAS